MPEFTGHKPGIFENVLVAAVIAAIGLWAIAMAPPAWRGDEMLAELKANCDKQGGVMLESKSLFGGTGYKCAERLDR